MVIADVFSLIGILPFIFMDIIMILITWFHPLVMIKGVVNSIFIFAKILFLALFDVIVQILRIFFHKVFGLLKGGLWGIPHGPDQHWRHDQIASGVKDSFAYAKYMVQYILPYLAPKVVPKSITLPDGL